MLIIPLILSSLGVALSSAALSDKLVVSLGPANLISDGANHQCVFVQLQNSKGEPLQATEEVTVTLTSSRLDVGTVEGIVTIPAGSNFGEAKFRTTKNPGTTLITASATGFITGGAELTTFAQSTDSRLVIYPLPSVVPAVNGTTGKAVIEILNELGVPYPSAEDVPLTLLTNSSVLTLPKNATIRAGSYYVAVDYKVTGNFTIVHNSTVTRIGNVTLSALAQGFRPGLSSVDVRLPGNTTHSLLLEVGPSIMLPSGSLANSSSVSLLDAEGSPVVLNGTAITVSLSSSADRAVARVEKSVRIENGTFCSYLDLTSLGRGASLIAASAQGLTLDTKTITVDGSEPSKLQAYVTPANILRGNPLKPLVTVEVIDQNGLPIVVDEDVNVFLSSSNTAIGSIAQFVTIPKGRYYAQVEVAPESETGEIDVSASARGLEPSIGSFKTMELTMNATLSATRPLQIGDKVTATIAVDRLGDPVKGANVVWSVVGGIVQTSNATTDVNGAAIATILQTSATMRISVHLSKAGYGDVGLNRLSTVPVQQSTELTVNILGLVVPLFYLIVAIGVLVIAVFALYIYLKYRRRNSDKLEVVG